MEHRKTVQVAIRQLGGIDVSIENFGALEERPTDECIRLVQQESDVFVGIYAHRYGYVPDGAELSISEMEYKAASEVSFPRFIYIVDGNHPWRPGYIDMGESRARLVAVKGALQRRHICQVFDTHDHLAAKVAADVGRHIVLQKTKKVGAISPAPSISFESLQLASIEIPEQWNEQHNAFYAEHRGIFSLISSNHRRFPVRRLMFSSTSFAIKLRVCLMFGSQNFFWVRIGGARSFQLLSRMDLLVYLHPHSAHFFAFSELPSRMIRM